MKKMFLILSLACIISVSCNKADDTPESGDDYYAKLENYISTIMKTYYWWWDEMPTPTWEKDAQKYFKGHLVAKDKWSWSTTGEDWRNRQSGTSSGSFGATYGQPVEGYGDYRIYVRSVYKGSAFDKAGITRGWRLDKIGGNTVTDLIKSEEGIATLNKELAKTSNSYVFTDTEGKVHSLDLSMISFSTNSYYHKCIFTAKDFPGLKGKVGYFNYWTFNDYLAGDIDNAISEFKSEGVSDIIIDLRYNGGGSGNVSTRFASLLLPSKFDGECFYMTTHNSKNTNLDETAYYAISGSSLELSRVFFIIGPGSASASEVLINGLRDALGKENVIMVGDNSYGKANGMYGFAYPHGDTDDTFYDTADFVFLPICFYDVNRAGESIPENGFTPTYECPDDLYHNWGAEEELTKACLNYISTGSFGQTKADRPAIGAVREGLRIPGPEDDPDYGTFICVPRY